MFSFNFLFNKGTLPFTTNDLNRVPKEVFKGKKAELLVDALTYIRAYRVDTKAFEEWNNRVTDELLRESKLFPNGLVEFEDVYARCHAMHIACLCNGEKETMRDVMERYVKKASHFHPQDPPPPSVPTEGGDLLKWLRRFTVNQLLAVGW